MAVNSSNGTHMNQQIKMNLAKVIDHTNLTPDCTKTDIDILCLEAIEHGFASVCVPPNFVSYSAKLVRNTQVAVCTVIGFPNGYATTETKVFETKDAIANGATEIDMVIAIGKLKAKDIAYVKNDIAKVYEICREKDVCLKVIIETALLNEQEKKRVLNLCASIGVDFVKTSTGFSHQGASIKDVSLLRSFLPEQIHIKASGGIKTKEFAEKLLQAGADRLGCSSSIQIVNKL